MTEPAVYGVSRDRPASVVYADIERAALTILATRAFDPRILWASVPAESPSTQTSG